MPNLIVVSTILTGLALMAPAPPPAAGELQTTLARLDASSAKFKNAQADFHKDDFLKLLGDHTPSEGSVYFTRTGAAVEAGIKINGKNGRIASYKAGLLKDYTPGASNCYNSIDSTQNKGKTESFLTLGFGGSGTKLAEAWTISDMGPEKVEGVTTEKLELVSKDQSVRNNFSKVVLWMDLDRDVSIKQQFYAAGTGDINTATYTNIRLNGKVDTAAFEFKAKPCK